MELYTATNVKVRACESPGCTLEVLVQRRPRNTDCNVLTGVLSKYIRIKLFIISCKKEINNN